MADNASKILTGTIGFFWPGYSRPGSIERQPQRGYLKFVEPDRIELTSLDEDPTAENRMSPPRRPILITGATELGGVVLLELTGTGSSMRFGGYRASVRRYTARTLIANVPIDKLRSDRLRSVSAHFFAVSGWLGLVSTSEGVTEDASNALKSYSLKVSAPEEQVVSVGGGIEVALSAHWYVTGTSDRRTILAPAEITCRSSRPKPIRQLRQPLLRIQDLMSLCFDGFIAADGGQAIPDLTQNPRDEPELWDGRLMTVPAGVSPPKSTSFPLLTLKDLGGLTAIKRWLRLCSQHLRAVRPIIEPYRQGKASPPLRLMEVAAAMEYWVGSHKRSSQWAHAKCQIPKHKGCGYAWTLAHHLGSAFTEWVGNVDRWTHLFWETYNKLKHEPGYEPDEYELWVLAESGALLLQACLLDRVATTKGPSRIIFKQAHGTWQLRDLVRDLVK